MESNLFQTITAIHCHKRDSRSHGEKYPSNGGRMRTRRKRNRHPREY